jgi:hypothetical protein
VIRSNKGSQLAIDHRNNVCITWEDVRQEPSKIIVAAVVVIIDNDSKLTINEVFASGQVPVVSSGHELTSVTWSDEGKEEICLLLMHNYDVRSQ